jgi:hypothetical protein
MAHDYSREGLLKFHDYLASKGLMNANTIAARKAAANKMLSILDESEASDLRSIDLDHLAERFFNLNKTDFTPDSLTTYKSRLKSAVSDFIQHTENPSSFKPLGAKLKTVGGKNGTIRRKEENWKGPSEPVQAERRTETTNEVTVQIPIREGVVVKFVGVPPDLKLKEAQKISNVILAYASDSTD